MTANDDVGPVQGYRERLWPTAGFWTLVPVASMTMAFVMVPIGVAAGIVTVVVTAVLVGAGLVLSAATIEVDSGRFRAGRAQIEVDLLGQVQAFHGAQAREQRGPALDGRAYLLLRGWIGPVLKVEVTDPDDPTPYWLVSTRHPEQLAEALAQVRH